MKKIVFISIMFFIIVQNSAAQTPPCDFDDYFESPSQEFLDAMEAYETAFLSYSNTNNGNAIIPIVIHVLYYDETDNISDNQIYRAIELVNHQLNGDDDEDGVIESNPTGIQLQWAMIDPNGNCTSGINRIEVDESVPISGNNQLDWKSLSRWDNLQYCNVWIVPRTSSILGSSTIPFTYSFHPLKDGISIRNTVFGDSGTASSSDGNVFAHELGHYLGLYHVWGRSNGPSSCAEGCHQPGENKGDRISDTNPCKSTTFFTTCDDYFECWELCNNNENKAYPKENYLSYATTCRNTYTPKQIDKFWFTLNGYRSNLLASQNQLCTGTDLVSLGHNIVIENSETWSTSNLPNGGIVLITGDLTIESGGVLIIESGVEIHFCELGRMVIKQGGKVLNHGKLTNACGAQWQGVEVWGTTNAPPGNPFYYPDQGYFKCYDGAVIENAEIAVSCTGPSILNESGGMFYAKGTEFINNTISVYIPPYSEGSGYPAHFYKCYFEADGSFPFESFIDLTDVKNVKISGCAFSYTGPANGLGISGYGYGILANSAGILVNSYGEERTTFSGLGYGIHLTSAIGNKPFDIIRAEFSNCFVGVYDGGMCVGKILWNDFNFGNVPDVSLLSGGDEAQIGLLIQNPLIGIKIQENNFHGTSNPSFSTIGANADNIGSHNNYIRKNIFQDCTYSNVATRKNGAAVLGGGKGLRYTCNTFGSEKYDLIVPEFSFSGVTLNSEINKRQTTGFNENTELFLSAGNTFSQPSEQFGDFNNEGKEIDYHYNSGTPGETPVKYFGIIPLESEMADCASEFDDPSYPPFVAGPPPPLTVLVEVKDSFMIIKAKYDEAVDELNNGNTTPEEEEILQEEISVCNDQMDALTDEAFFILTQDSLGLYTNEYYWWISQQDSYESDLWLVNEYAGDELWIQVNDLLQSLPVKWTLAGDDYLDWQHMVSIYSILQTEQIVSISTVNIEQLELIIAAGLQYSSLLANNILFCNKEGKEANYYLPEEFRNRNSQENSLENKDHHFQVAPNPTNEWFKISWEDTRLEKVRISIFNNTNVEILSKVVHSDEPIPVDGLPSGIYSVCIYRSEKLIDTEKLVIVQ